MRQSMSVILGLMLLFITGNAASLEFSSLEERMTVSEFKATGLDKLSPEQLTALNDWLRRDLARLPAVAELPPVDRRGLHSGDSEGGPIHSNIPGTFRGWQGRTRITLENGQIWETDSGASFAGVRLENPGVTINPGSFGSWHLQVDGYNTTARVRRIK